MIRTTCAYCGVGCGIAATRTGDRSVAIKGDTEHPANRGRLCSKGTHLGETVGLEGRLLQPIIGQRRASWDKALDLVAKKFREAIARHGPDSVAFYVSGQLLTEDYYVANKLMKGFIGSANIDTNSRLCMSSAVAGHLRAFGEDVVPVSYDDLEQADLVVLVGSNTAGCHPIVYQRIQAARAARGTRLVVIDPRRTETCDDADLHLAIRPGSDVALMNGLLAHMRREGLVDEAYLAAHVTTPEGYWDSLDEGHDLWTTAKICDVPPADLARFYDLFATTPRAITLFSQGINQALRGTDQVNAITNLHLATGRIGKPGAGPFSITGQPNAMGGREVGGLANMLAAHMELHEPVHREIVQSFWSSPRMASQPGLKAVALFDAMLEGRIKAVWIMGTNPVVSLPDADRAKRALDNCELVVCSDIVERTDTNAHAHVLLPALGWGEKDGTVTSSERRISRQRAFLPAPGEARADWRIICDVARRLGFAQGFAFDSARDIFVEHARLTAFRNHAPEHDGHPAAKRELNLRGLTSLSPQEYDAMRPVQWPVHEDGTGTQRLFTGHRFAHADGRARLIATPARLPAHAPDREYPLVLNTGRVRDQWHTMTRTGKSPKLAGHISEPYVDMHPNDALRSGVREGELARVQSSWGAMVARVRQGGGILAGSVFVPIHWNDQFASDARVGGLVNPVVDPVSGEPEFKHTPVRVEPFPVRWYGFAFGRRFLPAAQLSYWTLIRGDRFVRYEIAHRERPRDCSAWARAWLGVHADDVDWVEYEDRGTGVYRAAHVQDGRIEACVFLSARPDLPSRHWLAGLFARDALGEADRIALLAGEPPGGSADVGPVVCSCFGVGRNTISEAIRTKALDTPAGITAALRAGGNCGSCVPELRRLIAEAHAAADA